MPSFIPLSHHCFILKFARRLNMFNMLTVSFNNFLNWAISLEFTPAPGAEAKKIRLTVDTAAELCVLGSCLLSWDPALLPPSTNHTLPLQDLVSLGGAGAGPGKESACAEATPAAAQPRDPPPHHTGHAALHPSRGGGRPSPLRPPSPSHQGHPTRHLTSAPQKAIQTRG